MRLRRKPWARPELAQCDFFIDDPTQYKNRWQQEFGNSNPIFLELGCGKGGFVAALGRQTPQKNFLAIDLKSEVLALAERKAIRLYSEYNLSPVTNLRLMSQDIERLSMIFGEQDKISRIYINFCNPWSRPGHAKHRLTHTRQLLSYKNFLVPGGQLWFKTDDDGLFEDTLDYIGEAGYQLRYLTRDLHNDTFAENIVTEHEQMFSEQGILIKFLIAEVKG